MRTTRYRLILALLGSACVAATSPAQTTTQPYVSTASRIIATYAPKSRIHSPASMAAAANRFLNSLSHDLKPKAALGLQHPERRQWTNLPAKPDAGGLRIGQLTGTQVELLCDLMAELFSEQGYDKMCSIMLADDQLLRGGRARPGFGTEQFSVVLFGTPAADAAWAFQLDGHHVGVNLSLHGEQLTMSPSFIGTQPQAFHLASTKYRPLANESDGAYQLAGSLNDDQRAQAVVADRRGRIRTGPGKDGQVPQAEGVSCSTFGEHQKTMLLSLIEQWIHDLPEPYASRRMQRIRDALDDTYFAWYGSTEVGSDISYAIQGPSLIIEYAGQDLGGNPLNHLHTMYRDPTNEYGKQLSSVAGGNGTQGS